MKPPSSEKSQFKFHHIKNLQAWLTDADGNQDKEKKIVFSNEKLVPSQNLHINTITLSMYMLNQFGQKSGQGKKISP